MFDLISKSPKQTQKIGRELGEQAQAGDLILLSGNLGAGKTCFTQGLAHGIGFTGYASSPSFMLVREYQGKLKIYHLDLYRLASPEEIEGLGIDEYLAEDSVCVIEWAEKGLQVLPPEHIFITFEYLPEETRRRLRFEAYGTRYSQILKELEGKWN